jgi:hypothetical protein
MVKVKVLPQSSLESNEIDSPGFETKLFTVATPMPDPMWDFKKNRS